MNENNWFVIEFMTILFDTCWIYGGTYLLINKEIPLIPFLLITGYLLYQTFKLIFTENRTEQRKTLNTIK